MWDRIDADYIITDNVRDFPPVGTKNAPVSLLPPMRLRSFSFRRHRNMNGYLIICVRKGGQPIMSDYDQDQDLYDYDDDERFYEETVYNEEYYIEQERELIRQSNLDLELEELEEKHIRDMREEGLMRPVLIKPEESESEAEKESPLDQPEIEIPF